MAKVLIRNIRSGRRKAAITELKSIARKEIEQAMDNKVKPALLASHRRIVRNWKSDVDFNARKFLRADSISINIFPTGADKEVWIWVDQGTRPHPIPERVPKRAQALRFQAGGKYNPKTLARPARTVSGGGTVTGGTTVFAKRARAYTHPGSEAREFTKTIAEDISPDFKKEIENAFRRAARQTEE